jgi:hypothetical protein
VTNLRQPTTVRRRTEDDEPSDKKEAPEEK